MEISFIQIPRSLLNHPAVIEAPMPQFKVLIYLIEMACYLPCKFYDHGKLMDLKPGQLVITQRGFAKKIKVSDNDVRRALKRFFEVQILTQEVKHTKTIVNIIHLDTYKLIKQYSESKSDARVTQERRKSDAEKDKEDKVDTEEKLQKKLHKEKILIREFVALTADERDKLFHLHGDKLANSMLDILDSYNTSRQKKYLSDYGAMKQGGWVHKEALSRTEPKIPFNSRVNNETVKQSISRKHLEEYAKSNGSFNDCVHDFSNF